MTITLYFKQNSVSLLSYGHQTTLLKREMVEREMVEKEVQRMRTKKKRKRKVLIPKNNEKEKLFTHPSFLIAPLKHSTNETHCWEKKLCKEI